MATWTPTPKVLSHLDLCLDCRACEAACPAGVKYGAVIEDARAGLESDGRRSFWDTQFRDFFLRGVFPSPARLRTLARGLRLSQRLGLDRAAVKLGLVRGRMAVMSETARVPPRFGSDVLPEFIPAKASAAIKVAFLEGCVSDVMFGPTNVATVRVLAANGCEISVPAGQCCCGGLAFHFGDLEQARRQARRNIDVFLATDADYYHHERGRLRLDPQGVRPPAGRRPRLCREGQAVRRQGPRHHGVPGGASTWCLRRAACRSR